MSQATPEDADGGEGHWGQGRGLNKRRLLALRRHSIRYLRSELGEPHPFCWVRLLPHGELSAYQPSDIFLSPPPSPFLPSLFSSLRHGETGSGLASHSGGASKHWKSLQGEGEAQREEKEGVSCTRHWEKQRCS